jgi:hypothetical protein
LEPATLSASPNKVRLGRGKGLLAAAERPGVHKVEVREMEKYSGILSTPLEPDDGPESYWERIEALADHYEIDLDDDAAWLRLTFELCAAHVPGFKMKEADLPREGTEDHDTAVLREMLARIKETGSVHEAATAVVQTRPDLGYADAKPLREWFNDFTNPANRHYDKRRALAFILARYGT